jgi:hypothetical protein
LPTINWELLLIERLRAFDPTIDTSAGSAAREKIITPLLARLSPDVLEVSPEKFILTRLQQEHPELYIQDGGSTNDVLIGPAATILDGMRREIREVRNSISLANPDTLSADDVDARVENFFISRDLGAYATVRVRLYFSNPVAVVIGTANTGYTATSLRFVPVAPSRFTASTVLLNKDSSGLYYVDASLRAERPGAAYSIGAGEIIGMTGMPAAVRVTNLDAATPGRDSQTNAQLIDATGFSLGERSLNTLSGINAVLKVKEFPAIDLLQVVGFNDEEMQRDVVSGGGLGPILFNGSDIFTVDDGDVDGYTSVVQFTAFNVTGSLGAIGTDLSDYVLTTADLAGVYDFTLGEVLSSSSFSIAESYTGTARISDAIAGTGWTIRRGDVLLLSDMPGGILFPSSGGVTVSVPPGEVHVGSCTDIFVRGTELEERALAVAVAADQDAFVWGEDAAITLGDDEIVLNDLSDDDWALTTVGMSIHIETGSPASFRVIEVSGTGVLPRFVRVTEPMPATLTGLSYALVDDVDIDLVEPRVRKWEGNDLASVAGLPDVETGSGLPNFVAIGVVAGDYLRILNGDDAGEYEVLGATVSKVTLVTPLNNTAAPLQFEIYAKQEGVALPVVRVTEVELLDGDAVPTGDVVPYRVPVDVRSRSFQNPGRGPTAGSAASLSGDTLTAVSHDVFTSSDPALNFWSLGVRVGDKVNIIGSDNHGYYTVTQVGGDPSATVLDNQLRVTEYVGFLIAGMEYVVGPVSYGSFRVYFKDPCACEVTYADTAFAVDVLSEDRWFRPDPLVAAELLPTTVTAPTVKFTAASDTVETFFPDGSVLDPMAFDLRVGDVVEIAYVPIVGVLDITTANVDGTTLLIDVGQGPERVFLTGTSASVDDIVDQINAQLSLTVASNYENPADPGSEHVMLRGDFPVTLLDNTVDPAFVDGTALVFGAVRNQAPDQVFQPWWAATPFAGADTTNSSPTGTWGTYVVESLTETSLTLRTWLAFPSWVPSLPWTGPGAGYTVAQDDLGAFVHVRRLGCQRIGATAMSQNVDETGLFYFDVEAVSAGHGDEWNIGADEAGSVSGYTSEGWALRTESITTSYSMAERLWLDISPRFSPAGDPDDWTSSIELAGRALQVSYQRDDVVQQVHDFVRDRTTRVTCNNPLARSLLPVFVRTNIVYSGGSAASVVRGELEALIRAVTPDNYLEASDVESIVSRSGATYIQHPITLVGLAHQVDRSVQVERSLDRISFSRLYGLQPDEDAGESLIVLDRTA